MYSLVRFFYKVWFNFILPVHRISYFYILRNITSSLTTFGFLFSTVRNSTKVVYTLHNTECRFFYLICIHVFVLQITFQNSHFNIFFQFITRHPCFKSCEDFLNLRCPLDKHDYN